MKNFDTIVFVVKATKNIRIDFLKMSNLKEKGEADGKDYFISKSKRGSW